MVTLVETKSESRTRRAGRLRGGVCGSAGKSVESAQSVDRHRVAESYPLGGNGVAPATTNYPGAAAHTRLGGGTGFRRDEAVFSSRNAAPLNIYYDSNWQAIEVRTNGTAASNMTSQTVWSAAYINAPVLQDSYVAGVLVPDSRLYFQQDANWNTTAVVGLVGGSWQVVQRFVYSPYGNILILNPSFTPAAAGTAPLVQNLYQGMLQDPVTGLYYERYRNYSPTLGTWISQDPLSYINGANTYQFVMSNPAGRVDPWGLWSPYLINPSWPVAEPGNFGGALNEPPLLPINSPSGDPVTLSFGTNNFMADMGKFDVRIWSGSSYGPFGSAVAVKFHPAARAVADCDTIMAIQFASTAHFYDVVVPVGGGWHLDNGASFYGKAEYGPGGYPFYAGATVWGYKNPKYLPLLSLDDLGASVPFYHLDWGVEQKFKLYAVVTDGRDKGKSLGYASWGQIVYWGPARFPGASAAGVKRWVEGVSWSGTAAQNGGVDRNGLAPLPGQITW